MLRAFPIFLFLLVCMQSRAQVDSTAQLHEIVITANRDKARLKDLPYAVSRLDQKQLQRNLSRTIPEALTGTAGLFIQKTNHGGGSPFLRGLTGNQALMLVDGIRLNNAVFRYGPNQYMTLIDPYVVDRIEVLKGTGAVQYGSDAMTGVINVITPDLKFSDQSRWSTKIIQRTTSDRMEFTLRPQLIYAGKRFSFSMAAGNKNFGDLKGGDSTGFQRPSGYREQNIDLNIKADLGNSWLVKAVYQGLKQTDVPVYHKYVLENFVQNIADPIFRSMGYLKLNKQYTKGILRSMEHFFSHQTIAEVRFLSRNGSTITRRENDKVGTIGAGTNFHLRFNKHWQASAGWEWYQDKIQSARTDEDRLNQRITALRGLYPDGSTYTNKAIYFLHHFAFGKFNIDAGTRYNAYKSSIYDSILGDIIIRPAAWVFQGGINYAIANHLNLYVNLTEGFRAPNIDDMGTLGIVDFRYEEPAYDLKPERTLNRELGIRYQKQNWNASFAVFRTDLKGLITRLKTGSRMSGYDVYRKVNVDRGFIRGWEAQFEVKPFRNLLITGMATHLFGQSITKNEPLRRIPPFNTRLGLIYEKNTMAIGCIFDHADPQRRLESGDKADNRIPAGGTPGFNVFNAFLNKEVKKLTLGLYISNIFNVDYRTHGSGINGMGRALSLTMVWNPDLN